jgi:large subunit ribosomal protein L3
MKCILGVKKGMTQVFDEHGACHPATILEAEPATVAAVRTTENDGYSAIQVTSGTQKPVRVNKARRGAHQEARHVREFRIRPFEAEGAAAIETGTTLSVAQFTPGDKVQVSANSKGKGFQGVVKRHGFAGGPKTHGNKHHERAPGSIGATEPARVFKGKKMAGRMGGERVTVKNITVVQTVPHQNLLLVRGAVPGRNGAVVEVRSS